MTTDEFYAKLGQLLDVGLRSDALDLIFDVVEDHLLEGCLDEAREILRVALSYVDSFPLSVFLSLLCVTRPWSKLLVPERTALAEAVRPGAEDPGCVDRLMS